MTSGPIARRYESSRVPFQSNGYTVSIGMRSTHVGIGAIYALPHGFPGVSD
jgi:hypothetical protein